MPTSSGSPPAGSRASRCSRARSTGSTPSATAGPSRRPTGGWRGSRISTSRSPQGSRGTWPSARGSTRRSFEIVHYGIVPGPQPPPPPGAPRLAVVGRLVPIKGHAILLEALAAARARVPALTLEVAGDGPLDGELRGLAERHGVADAVTFLGRVAPVAPVLERAEIVVVPSLGEGFGMVALEAMERGRPVVASAVGGLPEIVEDGRTGLLVPTGDAASLAAALVDLASDPARAAAMGAAGRERAVTAFTQARCTDRTDALYRAALAEAPARRSRRSSQARSSANAASSASTKSHGTR